MRQFTAYFNYIDGITLSEDVVRQCSHSGSCDNDVAECRELPEVKRQLDAINPKQLAKELKEYGAWDEIELSNHSANIDRILWIAAGDIMDSDEFPND
jgi:hypothetical protein